MIYYRIQHELSPEDIIQKLNMAEEMLREIRSRKPFTSQKKLADDEADAAQKCELFFCFSTWLKDPAWQQLSSSDQVIVTGNSESILSLLSEYVDFSSYWDIGAFIAWEYVLSWQA